ncbi:MAG: nucleotidyltransferase family protein [Anaerolineae bacterium]
MFAQDPFPAALVLAAGFSRRMGCFKLTLPWGDRTVIGQVVATLTAAGLQEIVVVTGHRAEEVVAALAGTDVRFVPNPAYAAGEMLSSVQVGLAGLSTDCPAALLCLGDQPQMEAATVRAIIAAGRTAGWQKIVIPSYRMRAGHPILLPRWLWGEVLACQSTLRDVLAGRRSETIFLAVETPTVLADLDTPEDYARATSNVSRETSYVK